jgi:cell division protein FtsA
MTGARLEAKVHIVTGAVDSGAEHRQVREPRQPATCRPSCCSSWPRAKAVLTEDEKDLGVCLIDIGGGTTDIAIFRTAAVVHTAVSAGRQPPDQRHRRGPAHAAWRQRAIKQRFGCALAAMVDKPR